jgi:lipopolysaccharide export system ATP-binding protein
MIVGLLSRARAHHARGKDITDEPVYRAARMGLGYLAQEPSIFRRLTVRRTCSRSRNHDDEEEGRDERLGMLLEELNLTHLAIAGHKLSGGERRRVEITRALARSRRTCCSTSRSWASTDRGSEIQDIVAGCARAARRADHRPQRAGNAAHHRPRVHHLRRTNPPAGIRGQLANDEQAREIYLGERFTS